MEIQQLDKPKNVLEERVEIQNRIKNSIHEFNETLENMKRVREETKDEKQRRIEERSKQKKNEKLFARKIDGLTKKQDFVSTVASR